MDIDFDQKIDHRGVNSIKWEFVIGKDGLRHWDLTDPEHGDDQVLPMWVADMDFTAAEPIVDAVTRRAARGLYGYCLLYTSPSPRDGLLSRMPSSA